MGNGNYSSQSFLSKNAVDTKRKEAQKKRLEQAKTVMADYNVSEAKRRKESKDVIKTVKKGSAKRENTATEQLKKVPETSEEKVRRHQDNPREVKELTQRIHALYENAGEKRPSRTQYLIGEIERGNNTVAEVISILRFNGISFNHSPSYTTTPFRSYNTSQPHGLPSNTPPSQ